MIKSLAFFLLLASTLSLSLYAQTRGKKYSEPLRPQFHFSPPQNFMNDPNGLVFYNDEYHLFYQYNPFGNVWGHMSWGHAVSKDLIHWQNLPVALKEENGLMMFSGCAVADINNTSGFFKGIKNGGLVAIYTAHTDTNQSQHIAYSKNNGRSWIKYEKNPVLDLHKKDFRDPKVFWHEQTHRWIMVAALPQERKVNFYSSANLKEWSYLSSFGPAGAPDGIWECPDLIELPIENSRQKKWVLLISLNPGGYAGGSGIQYFIGDFDGTAFRNDNPNDHTMWMDYGKDFYAASTWDHLPGKDIIGIGWISNWQYANTVPTTTWRNAQSIPRVLTLRKIGKSLHLAQNPVASLMQLREQGLTLQSIPLLPNKFYSHPKLRGSCFEMIATIQLKKSDGLEIHLRKGNNEETIVGYDRLREELFLDRRHSGQVAFSKDFPGRFAVPLVVKKGGILKLHLLVDQSSVEVFINDGEKTLTNIIFPNESSEGIEMKAVGDVCQIYSLAFYPLKSIWAGMDSR